MIYIIGEFVRGPFTLETPYKTACTDKLRTIWPSDTFVHVETEETEPGMPDTLRLSTVRTSLQVEYKVSDKYGVIKFKKSQPLWYKQHDDLRIVIIAWDKRLGQSVLITSDEIVKNASLRFHIPLDLFTHEFTRFERVMVG